ncbi:MAG: serine--tRNA ligase [Firmicutes bacterium]|nr:serine--tRNA ligase [Bacillota bacterium]
MLDLRYVCDNLDEVCRKLARRGMDLDLSKLVELSGKRLKAIKSGENLKAKRNKITDRVAKLKMQKLDATELIEQSKKLGEQIKKQDSALLKTEQKIKDILVMLPNLPSDCVPFGADESQNVEVKKHLEPTKFAFQPKPHYDIAVSKNIISFDLGAKITGSRFSVLIDKGAQLERALINFMLALQTAAGYIEIHAPVIVNENSMFNTGQLPKFKDDMFALSGTNYYLIPTSEVSLTNLYKDSVVDIADGKPTKVCAYSLCFRKEAGSAGRDTRGLIRQHQFSKIELVKIATPADSLNQLELMLSDACAVLETLELPYRVVALCTGDLGHNSHKTYDIEVWLPSYNKYVEISSVSVFADYQARRANIKYRDISGKTKLAHTLNGSGLAVGRLIAAIIENFQTENGDVVLPKALSKYLEFGVI